MTGNNVVPFTGKSSNDSDTISTDPLASFVYMVLCEMPAPMVANMIEDARTTTVTIDNEDIFAYAKKLAAKITKEA